VVKTRGGRDQNFGECIKAEESQGHHKVPKEELTAKNFPHKISKCNYRRGHCLQV